MEAGLAPTSQRVPLHTSDSVNAKIHEQTLKDLEKVGSDSAQINSRLAELDREWDIERAIEANASTLALAGLILGAGVNKRFYWLSTAVAGFLLQHALQGWCPPVPVLRRLGFRTQREIDNERALLKARRGDFDKIQQSSPQEALRMMEA